MSTSTPMNAENKTRNSTKHTHAVCFVIYNINIRENRRITVTFIKTKKNRW